MTMKSLRDSLLYLSLVLACASLIYGLLTLCGWLGVY